MKLFGSSPLPLTFLAVFALILSTANANFDLYCGPKSPTDLGCVIFDTDPSCDDVTSAPYYAWTDDVSGDKLGVRCDGCFTDGSDPAAINVVEMHFSNNPLFHWTIYKDRNYDLIGLDGNVYGHCIPFPSVSYNCPAGLLTSYSGNRLFRCLTQFTALQINAASLGMSN